MAQYVDYNYVANVARTNAVTLASLASAPATPGNVRYEMRGLNNNTTISWEPAPGGLASGYQILWRDTDQPFWQHAMNVAGSNTSITLPISKDNVIFAVRAEDANGHVSLPVVPRAGGRINVPGTTTSTAPPGM